MVASHKGWRVLAGSLHDFICFCLWQSLSPQQWRPRRRYQYFVLLFPNSPGIGSCQHGSDTKYCWSKFPGVMTSRRRPGPAALTAVYLQQISELCTFRFLTFSSFNVRNNVASVTYCWLPQSSASGKLSLWVNQTFSSTFKISCSVTS